MMPDCLTAWLAPPLVPIQQVTRITLDLRFIHVPGVRFWGIPSSQTRECSLSSLYQLWSCFWFQFPHSSYLLLFPDNRLLQAVCYAHAPQSLDPGWSSCLLPRTLFTLRPSNIQRLIGNIFSFSAAFFLPFSLDVPLRTLFRNDVLFSNSFSWT